MSRKPAPKIVRVSPWIPALIPSRDYCYEPGESEASREARAALSARVVATSAPNGVRVKPMPHYDAIAKEAARVGWPRSFASDLTVHDWRALDAHAPSEPFVWVLRYDGTHLSFDDPRYASRVASAFGDDRVRCYTWDGYALTHRRSAQRATEVFGKLLAKAAREADRKRREADRAA